MPKFSAWTPKDSLIYIGGQVLCVVGACWLILTLERNGAGWAEAHAPFALPVVWGLISFWRYVVRKRYKDSIAFVTPQGVQAIPGTMGWISDHQTEVARAIEEAVTFFGEYYTRTTGKTTVWDTIASYMDGGFLIASPGPVKDPRNGTEHTGGATVGNEMTVNADRPVGDFLWDLTHEAGHVVMNAVGEQRDHHDVMREAGWKYGL